MITIVDKKRYDSKTNILKDEGDGLILQLDMAYIKDWGKLKKAIDEINETPK